MQSHKEDTNKESKGYRDKGSGNFFIKMNIFVPPSILAMSRLIQGRQEKDVEMSYAVEKALSDLKQRNPKV